MQLAPIFLAHENVPHVLVKLPDSVLPRQVGNVGGKHVRPRLQHQRLHAAVAQRVGEHPPPHARANHHHIPHPVRVEGGREKRA